ncbi:MAG: hypothetical protein A2157_13510 [Deltaproteobacteria bacterium RBG_16_47_11]|nr:MAG: hypothetical protein A2157_13510 [Deltaproteobacteria bacterium RBG_16_47_11]
MIMNRKWMTLILLLGVMILSGCGISKESMMAYNEAKDAFQKATLAGAKNCAPCQYATAEAYLALADHEIAETDYWKDDRQHLKLAASVTKEKSLEAIKICQVPPKPPAPPAPAPAPAPAPPAVRAPVIDSFTANPSSITSGESSTLSWSLSGGAPTDLTINGRRVPLTSTSQTVTPSTTTTYTLAASNTAGQDTRSVTVTVASPPAPTPPPAPAPAPTPSAPLMLDTIYFDTNKTNINPSAAKALDRNGMLLKDNPRARVEIGGHTDSTGSEKANQMISEKRALSAKKYLQDKYNIPGDRMGTKGYGSSKPIADNKTKEGKAKNRRVEFKVIP